MDKKNKLQDIYVDKSGRLIAEFEKNSREIYPDDSDFNWYYSLLMDKIKANYSPVKEKKERD